MALKRSVYREGISTFLKPSLCFGHLSLTQCPRTSHFYDISCPYWQWMRKIILNADVWERPNAFNKLNSTYDSRLHPCHLNSLLLRHISSPPECSAHFHNEIALAHILKLSHKMHAVILFYDEMVNISTNILHCFPIGKLLYQQINATEENIINLYTKYCLPIQRKENITIEQTLHCLSYSQKQFMNLQYMYLCSAF